MPGRHRLRFASLLAVIVVVALAGACAPGADSGSDAPEGPPPTTVPHQGGRVVIGLSSEADGFLPAINRWTPASYMVARAIFDPLAAIDDSGVAQPYLAEAFEHNPAFTQWTIRLRHGITFHDGTPLTAEALERQFAAARLSAVTASAISYFDKTSSPDPYTFVIDLKAPWAHLPYLLSSQLGFIPAPSSYGERNAVAAKSPIGTGPFKFTGWDIGQHLDLDRWPSYWRKDAAGNQLPYLSQIQFQPVVDDSVRTNRLRSGDLDVIHTDSYAEVSGFQKMMRDNPGGRLQALLDASQGAEAGLALNTQTGPFSDRNLRLAAAYAIDRQGLVNELYKGFYELANGPFTATSKWGAATNYPTYFPERAKQLVNEAKARNKGKAPVIRMHDIAVADSVPFAQRIAKAWTDVGFDVQLKHDSEEHSTITLVTGDFDAILLRFWDRPDPDALYPYLIGASVTPPGQISLNFPRYADAEVDEAMKTARGLDDDGVRRVQYQRVWDNYAQNLPVIFLFHTRWAVGFQDRVHGIGELTLPTGQRAEPVTWGNFYLTGVWVA
jgi:peptide/nickel transport system substrate-binding protein